MRKRREVWTPDIYDMAQPRAAAPAEPDIYDMAQARAPGAADSDIEPLVGEGLMDAEPVIIEAPSNAAPPTARPRPGGDNSGLFGLMAGALLGAGLTLLAAPTSGARLRRQLRAIGARQAGSAEQATGTVAQIMPNMTSTEPEAPGAEQSNGG